MPKPRDLATCLSRLSSALTVRRLLRKHGEGVFQYSPQDTQRPLGRLAEAAHGTYRSKGMPSRYSACPMSKFRGPVAAIQRWGKDMTSLQASAQAQLRQLIEQIEHLEEEKKALAGDIRDKFLEAKAMGFDPKIMKQVIRLRKQPKDDRDEQEALLATYMHALGMLDASPADTPMMAAE